MMGASLYRQLKKFIKKDNIRFHMPGHNGGEALSARLKRDYFRLDVTEFEETDDLQNPTGVLFDAQKNAADAFGAGKTFFLTCGSTMGLEALVMGCCPRGSALLVDRNCHRSIISALILGGINPVFISPHWDSANHVWRGFTADSVKSALDGAPECVGALITSPTYYGVCSQLEKIAEYLHGRGKFLLVDEAHGVHFAFSDRLPQTALSQGADACVQSLHKTLPAMGQSALLHIAVHPLFDPQAVERTLRLMHTTSPSYAMMASMDEAVRTMRGNGTKKLEQLIDRCTELKTKMEILGRLRILNSAELGCAQDPLRLTVGFEKIGITGRRAAKILQQKYGIYAEMADFWQTVFIVTAGNTKKELDLLESALEDLATEVPPDEPEQAADLLLPPIELALSPEQAFFAPRETLTLGQAEGRICAELIASCPPGAAAVVPGQRLTPEALCYLKIQEGRQTVEVTAE